MLERFSEKQIEALRMQISDVGFSVRTRNCCVFLRIQSIWQAVYRSELVMLKMPNFGKVSFQEMKAWLQAHDLHFGMELSENEIEALKADSPAPYPKPSAQPTALTEVAGSQLAKSLMIMLRSVRWRDNAEKAICRDGILTLLGIVLKEEEFLSNHSQAEVLFGAVLDLHKKIEFPTDPFYDMLELITLRMSRE